MQRFAYTAGLVVLSLLATAVPIVTGVIARRRGTSWVPWFAVAGLVASYMISITLTSQSHVLLCTRM